MYTLEDDEETSARMRKRDFLNSPYANPARTQTTDPAELEQEPTRPIAPDQRPHLTDSLKTLAIPGKTTSPAEKRLAIAALLVACASVFVTSMDQTVVVTALPKIIADPGINIPITQLDHAAWIISAYLLGFVIAMPLMGRISDIFGRRRILLLCLAIFGAGSLLCALAPILGQSVSLAFLSTFHIDTSSPGLIWLIAARFIQALGGGAVIPVAIAVVSDLYGKKRLSLALGIIGAVTEAGGVVGPLYGALLVSTLGWTSIFYLNIPIVLLLMLGVIFFTPKYQRRGEGIDWLGALLLGLALTCLSLGLAQQGTDLGPVALNGSAPQNNPLALILAGVFFLLFILLGRLKSWRVPQLSFRQTPRFALVQRQRWPVVDLALFKRLPLSAAALVSLLVGVGLIIAMADIPLAIDTVYSQQIPASDLALVSGLALLRMTALIPVGALLGGWLCGKLTCRVVGVVGLLLAALGFYLMSRWSIMLNWTEITVSTMIAGLGFGLVIAPVSTTALNAVKPSQAGQSAAVITALRMVGMILGLAALTSWGLAYFKQLAAQFPSLHPHATLAEFAQWTKNYANYLVGAEHSVYSAIFFATTLLILVAVLPAFFLWGNKPAVAATEAPEDILGSVPATDPESELTPMMLSATALLPETLADEDVPQTPPTQEIDITQQAPFAQEVDGVPQLPFAEQMTFALDATEVMPAPPVTPPAFVEAEMAPAPAGSGYNGNNPRRRTISALIAVALILLLVGGGLTAFLLWPASSTSLNASNVGQQPTSTPASGPRMIELAMNNVALTSIFVAQLGQTNGTLSNIQTTPVANNGLVITLDLNINADGIQRVMPVELDTRLGLDKQQDIQLTVVHLKRDGQDAGPTAAASMQKALNQLVLATIMPALRGQLQGAKLISVQTSSTLACSKGVEMFVLLIQAPPLQGVAAQPTPTALCFLKPVDLNKLLV